MNYAKPKIAESAKIAKEAVLLGDVTIGEESIVLFLVL